MQIREISKESFERIIMESVDDFDEKSIDVYRRHANGAWDILGGHFAWMNIYDCDAEEKAYQEWLKNQT